DGAGRAEDQDFGHRTALFVWAGGAGKSSRSVAEWAGEKDRIEEIVTGASVPGDRWAIFRCRFSSETEPWGR
ncbi:MAG TPA: hypothetical protein VKB29_03235, partial [Candidatus Binataceae bacterium]|nr:hypothetical protein [Candidatus Binataceae bacterium]